MTSRLTLQEFIKRSNETHDNRYDYSKSIYVNRRSKIEIVCLKHGSFWQVAANHLYSAGCPKCISIISKPEIAWLDSLKIPQEYRHKTIVINNKRFNLDAFDPVTNTVYEFYGDFWHGNPKTHKPNKINPISKKSFSQLYNDTITKEKILKQAGYQVISIWENDFNQ